MKWQRVTRLSRLVCLLFGLVGLLIAWANLSDLEHLLKQPVQLLVFLVMAGFAFLAFLFVGIVGKFPDFSTREPGAQGE